MVKICPTCKKFVPESAKTCPQCGNTKLVAANAPATSQDTSKTTLQSQSSDSKRDKKENQKQTVLFIFITVIMVSVCAVIVKFAPTGGTTLKNAIEPHVREKITELKAQYGLSDLSYQFTISEQKYGTFATGEITFISDDIAKFEPKEQYELMQKIGTNFFSDLGTTMEFDGYTFMVEHGEGYSVWRTRHGDNYIASYFNLEKNGKEIYDNPNNDLEQHLADELGMTVDEYRDWKESISEKNNSTYISVESNDDDYWYAVTAAQNLVKDELKSPSTAKFPIDTSYIVKRNGNDWIVGGYVDAQNGFGAILRQNWVATFTMGDTSGSTYRVSNYNVIFP